VEDAGAAGIEENTFQGPIMPRSMLLGGGSTTYVPRVSGNSDGGAWFFVYRLKTAT